MLVATKNGRHPLSNRYRPFLPPYSFFYTYLLNHIKSRIRNQRLRNADAFGSLVVFEQCCDDTRQSQCATIQRMAELCLFILVTITAFQTVCLVIIEVRNRTYFQPTSKSKQRAAVKLISPPQRRKIRYGSSNFWSRPST